ncbi:MAG: hypothetical protein KTR28_08160 [Micavibrio sp.]|nr:hypothetical protein [Micavibrio sp.]
MPIIDSDKLYYIGIENLYRLAATRDLDFSKQSIYLLEHLFEGIIAPEFARVARADPAQKSDFAP